LLSPSARISRRRLLAAALVGLPLAIAGDSCLLEPKWVRTRTIRLASGKPTHRIVHITDVHHKGNRRYFESIVKRINALSPDFVCFTGDLIEEGHYLAEALQILSGIRSPVFGVPGNHDYWSHAPFGEFSKTFRATGGAWLLDEEVLSPDGKFNILGAAFLFKHRPMRLNPGAKNVMLMHYPAWVKKLGENRFDLILAGHSHGGQFRIPFYGAIMVPFGVDEYDLGLFRTIPGPLYVNPGLGWFPVPIRFNCRPEITVFEL
jgi:predicted MPP superfamily phosphohydrolase